jgi:hypothetical protein
MYKNNKEFLEDHDWLNDYEKIVFLSDEFVNSIVGFDSNLEKLVYSYQLMRDDLIDEGMEYEEACDYLDYNVMRALPYINNAPVLCMEL